MAAGWRGFAQWAKFALQGTLFKNLQAQAGFRATPEPSPGPVKKRNATAPKKKRARLKPLPPNAAAARDEGPRLLPLTPGKDQTGLEHFLRLADVALGRKKRDRDRLP